MNERNEIQAYAPKNAKLLLSGKGTAPGLIIEKDKKILIALPGVSKEFEKIFETEIEPVISKKSKTRKHTVKLTIYGIPEADCQSLIDTLYPLPNHLEICFKSSLTGLHINLINKKTKNDAQALAIEKEMVRILIPNIIGQSNTNLVEEVTQLLIKKNITLSIAESCTGGLLSKKLTDYPGSSKFLIESCVAYHNRQKIKRLSVKEETIKTYGAVSKETGIEMAQESRESCNSTIAISTTGIAGPGGETNHKPIGTIWISITNGKQTKNHKLNISGNREYIREKTVSEALFFLYKFMNNN